MDEGRVPNGGKAHRVVIGEVRQGEIWLAELSDPVGSLAGYVRPVVIVQGNEVNASKIPTYLAIPVTSNLRRQLMPTNLFLSARETGVAHDSVAQPTLLLAVDQSQLIEPIGMVQDRQLQKLFVQLDRVLGRA